MLFRQYKDNQFKSNYFKSKVSDSVSINYSALKTLIWRAFQGIYLVPSGPPEISQTSKKPLKMNVLSGFCLFIMLRLPKNDHSFGYQFGYLNQKLL